AEGPDQQQESHLQGGDAGPEQKAHRPYHLDGQQHEAEPQPVPVGQPLEQGCHDLPALPSLLNSSAMPATEPIRLPASRGIMMILLLGPSPMRARASVYF